MHNSNQKRNNMKNIKIYINDLGAIRNSEIELKPFMLYTGDSGLGKSYTSFVVHYLYKTLSTHGRLQSFIENKMNNVSEGNNASLSFRFKEFRQWLNEGVASYIGGLIGHDDFHCNITFVLDIDDDEQINISYSEPTPNTDKQDLRHVKINDMDFYFPMAYGNRNYNITDGFSKYLCRNIYGVDSKIPLLFPPARAAFAASSTGDTSPIGMYQEFINGLNVLNVISSWKNFDEQLLNSMMRNLVGGELVRKENKVYIQVSPEVDNLIPISAAASSVKELLPLFLLMKNNLVISIFQVLFEEPEAHVHPSKQYVVADMIARCFNRGAMFQITTHSDYLMSRINQLIRLGNIRNKDEKLFDEFCTKNEHNRKLYLDAEKIGAYYFSRDENGDVRIEKLGTDNGIDFKTFSPIVNKQLEIESVIEEYENKLCKD